MVDVHGPLSNSEPKTAALDFAARRVGTIKAFEDVRKISFGDADAGIRHFNDGCAFVLSKRYLNAARLRRVLHGIVEQNPEHSLETGSVTEHRNSLLGANYKVHRNCSSAREFPDHLASVLDDVHEVNGFESNIE
jgi:hypothetical protein